MYTHGLSEEQQFGLLGKILDKSLTFAEADALAKDMKAEEKVCACI